MEHKKFRDRLIAIVALLDLHLISVSFAELILIIQFWAKSDNQCLLPTSSAQIRKRGNTHQSEWPRIERRVDPASSWLCLSHIIWRSHKNSDIWLDSPLSHHGTMAWHGIPKGIFFLQWLDDWMAEWDMKERTTTHSNAKLNILQRDD